MTYWKQFMIFIIFLMTAHCAMAKVSPSPLNDDERAVEFFRQQARPLRNSADLDYLVQASGDKRVVLLGEASHGTSEYYRWRTKFSRRLIEEKGFRFILVEGDWPAGFEVNRYIRGMTGKPGDAREILQKYYTRWPAWMWANEETVLLVEWLRDFNSGRPAEEQVSFYGMDVYSLPESARELERYLAGDEELADLTNHLRCLERFDYDGWAYAHSVSAGGEDCGAPVRHLVEVLRGRAGDVLPLDRYEWLNAKQNAVVVSNAKDYFRQAVAGGPGGWNSRVLHMKGTLNRLLNFYGAQAQAIVWAHNTHIGDARATMMSLSGQVNIGQLARERFGAENVFAIGFGAGSGTVMAGRRWGDAREVMAVPQAEPGSVEELLSRVEHPIFWMIFDEESRQKEYVLTPRGHRAIGVVYHPERERLGNYVLTRLPLRYDAFIFFKETRALQPVSD